MRLRNKLTNFLPKDIILVHIASYMRQKIIYFFDVLKTTKKVQIVLRGPVQNHEHKKNFELVKKNFKIEP